MSLIQAGYNLEGTHEQWLQRILERCRPLLGRAGCPLAWSFHRSPREFSLGSFSTETPHSLTCPVRSTLELAFDALDLIHRSGLVLATASELGLPRLPLMQQLLHQLLPSGFRDLLVLHCDSGQGNGFCVALLLVERSSTTRLERRRWGRIATHLAAANRVRLTLAERKAEPALLDCILDPSPKTQHARDPAKAPDARTQLRHWVRRTEQLRFRTGRTNVEDALAQWEGLINGRWSLVDQFDSDGRRYILAVRNAPAQPDPRGLTRCERQAAELVGLGRTAKEIACILGLSPSAITNCTKRAQLKLGLSSRAELAEFFAPHGLRRKLSARSLNGERWLVGSRALPAGPKLDLLTPAERDVLAMMMSGSTNADVARQRSTCLRTVANQVQSIFQKLGVHSRGEMAASLVAS